MKTKVLLILVSLMMLCSVSSEAVPSEKAHHTPDGFRNIHGYGEKHFTEFLRWRWERLWMDKGRTKDASFSMGENNPDFLIKNRHKQTLTWIGHATVLVQIAGVNILTDPHFSQRASPVQWAGPERVMPPGLAFEHLPPIHMVVISHDHYDSLDKETVIRLVKREGGKNTVFFVPLGLKKWFLSLGVMRVVEMDWWDSRNDMGVEIIMVPVQHWSKRKLFSKNKSLWGGWVIRTGDFSFLFVGDTGFTPHFLEIGRRLGPFDLAAIPIGAYEPRWFMRYHHMNPEEAVDAHLNLQSKKSVAIHWGTFVLTDEPLAEPPIRLKKAMMEKEIPSDTFLVLKHGESIVFH